MTSVPTKPRRSAFRRWLHIAFGVWAIGSTLWLANSVRTRGVDDRLLQNSDRVSVVDGDTTLEFVPAAPDGGAGLIFFCGSGVAARAYAPLLRPIADAGFRVVTVRLPYRFAPLEPHKLEAIERARAAMRDAPERRWVVAGHSLGGALAARMAESDPGRVSALALVGTTHPKNRDLSRLRVPVTKIYGTNDGVAPAQKVLANRGLLPAHTKWVPIAGGNHSQFGHYGRQLFDGGATITRDTQQRIVRTELLELLRTVGRAAGSSEGVPAS
jgi:hypothetical protein